MKKIVCAILLSSFSLFAVAQQILTYSVGNDKPAEDESVYINIDEYGNVIEEYEVEYDISPVDKKTEERTEEVRDVQPSKSFKETVKHLSAPRRVRYSGMVETGFGYDLAAWGNGFTWSLSTTHGAQIGNYFFIGAGVGYSLLSDESYSYYGDYDYQDWSHAIDFFVDMRIYLAKGKCIPYFDFKGGVGTAVWCRRSNGFTGSYSAGFGLVIANHFDMRFAWTGRDDIEECSFALKLGVRF